MGQSQLTHFDFLFFFTFKLIRLMIRASAYTLLNQEQKQRNKCCFYTLQCSHTHFFTS